MSDQITNNPVSVIIPTFNGRHLLEQNLTTVVRAMRSKDQLIIIDDASNDDTLEWLDRQFNFNPPVQNQDQYGQATVWEVESKNSQGRLLGINQSEFPAITISLISNSQNLRFAAACNRAARFASHAYLFLLNNDVSLTSGVISSLLTEFNQHHDLFAATCLQISEAEGVHTKNNKQIESGKNCLWFDKGLFMHSKAADLNAGSTAWASGGSSMFDQEKWQQLGGFDTDFYPAYWEDIDLSYRARKRGWEIWFSSDAVVYHNHESTNLSAFGRSQIEHLSWKHAHHFVWKHGSLWQKMQNIFWRPYWWLQRIRRS